MFGKRRSQAVVPPPKKKRKQAPAIEEISFDLSAREDYLSGFHKRKLQRIKHAKEEGAKKDRQEKLEARKILREGRKADLERQVEAVNAMLRASSEQGVDSNGEGQTVLEESWDGIGEESPVDHDDEYVDEDRLTTVTIEAVDVSKDGLHKATNETLEEGQDDEKNTSMKTSATPGKERSRGPKKKKKKFRYESKAERKVTRYKERAGGKAKAKERKS